MSSEVLEKCGLIPRILETIFLILAAEKDQSGVEVDFLVRCSSLQIYNEQVEDLLCPDSTNLTIHEDAKMGMYVEGLQEVEVQTPEATYEVLRRGSLNRHVGATAMNSESSRSHGVFILSVESQRQDLGVLNRRISRFYLVDLAGSERQKQTEAVGLRLKESGSINRSLSALGNVIKALLETSEGKIRHIPYRDSKLTYLLKDALGGNSKCTLIANISPSIINLEETLSTLKFAQRAKFIRNVAIVNEDTLGNSSVSSEEVKRLRLEIASLRARMGSTSAGDQAISWNDHSSNNQVRRLEYIISQSTKQALAGERKTAQEMHSLTRKMDALKSLYLRLDRTLQGLNASTLQKQRRRDNSPTFSPTQTHKKMARLHDSNTSTWDGVKMGSNNGASYRELNDGPKKMLGEMKHHLERSFNDGDEDKFEGRLEIHPQEENPTALKSRVLQLKTMNQSLKLEVENLGKEKKLMFSEFSDVKRERDQSKKRLASLEDQISKLQDTIQKLKQESDKETQSSDDERRTLINFQKKTHIQAFKRFISRPRVIEVHHQQPSLLCRLLKRKKWSGSSSRLTS